MPSVTKSRCWLFILPGITDVAEPYQLKITSARFVSWYLSPEGIKGFVRYRVPCSTPLKPFKGLSPHWSPTTVDDYSLFTQDAVDLKTFGESSFITRSKPISKYISIKRSKQPFYAPDTDTDRIPYHITVSIDPITGVLTESYVPIK